MTVNCVKTGSKTLKGTNIITITFVQGSADYHDLVYPALF